MVCDPLTGLYPLWAGIIELGGQQLGRLSPRVGPPTPLQRRGNRAAPRGVFASEKAGSGPLLTARSGSPTD